MAEIERCEHYTVRYYEADAGGTLAAHILCGFLQEIAGHHAGALGVGVEELFKKGLTWFLSRMRLLIDRSPRTGERIEVRTWPSGIDRLFALRDFVVTDGEGAPLASATSAWLVMDARSRKPARIQSIWDSPDTSAIPRALPGGVPKLSPMKMRKPDNEGSSSGGQASGIRESRFPVMYSDIDVNLHVNNTSYVRWVIESAGAGVLESRRLASLAVDYLAETRYGSIVHASARPSAAKGETETLHHELRKEEDGQEIARARTVWKEKE
jgi:acyl-ACP thioesterase